MGKDDQGWPVWVLPLLLMLVGAGLLVVAVMGTWIAPGPSASTIDKTEVVTQTAPPGSTDPTKTKTTKVEVVVQTPAASSTDPSRSTTTTTEVVSQSPAPLGNPDKVVTTKTTTAARSDALTGGLLALGLITFLGGAFYRRITGLTLPFGGGLTLEAQAKIVETLVKKKPALAKKPEQLRHAYLRSAEKLGQMRRHTRGASPSDDYSINLATDQTLAEIR